MLLGGDGLGGFFYLGGLVEPEIDGLGGVEGGRGNLYRSLHTRVLRQHVHPMLQLGKRGHLAVGAARHRAQVLKVGVGAQFAVPHRVAEADGVEVLVPAEHLVVEAVHGPRIVLLSLRLPAVDLLPTGQVHETLKALTRHLRRDGQ